MLSCYKNTAYQMKYCNICKKVYFEHKTNNLKDSKSLDSATSKKMNIILQNIK